jgi:hypothetical protein
MSNDKNARIKWAPAFLSVEGLNCKNNPEHFERLVKAVTDELVRRVISKKELFQITTDREVRFFVHQALYKYDAEKHRNLAWYAYTRLRFLISKWSRLQGTSKTTGR